MHTVIGAQVARLESERVVLQEALDGERDAAARNRMGQFATPTGLARDILRYAMTCLRPDEQVRFIDPAIGTGSFYSALLDTCPHHRIAAAAGNEIDPHYGVPAQKLWGDTGLDVRLTDFTRATSPSPAERFNLLVCNPPYVRHHHISGVEKRRLVARTRSASGMELSGLAGLYCHFLGQSHPWMSHRGLAGWLIPSEFMDVNYGAQVKRYLLNRVTLLHVHRFDPAEVQFGDALVSSSVLWFRNAVPPEDHRVRFTYGGTLERPNIERLVSAPALRQSPKWTRYPLEEARPAPEGPVLGDYFTIKRGLVTGNNKFFILSGREIGRRGLPLAAFRPILPSPRYVPENEIESDQGGNPILERRLFLLDPPWTEREIRERHRTLWAYLERGRAAGVAEGYVCRHRQRWYAQERRPPALFVCTYLGRSDKKSGRPFRFILNHSKATAANVYLMLYPKRFVKRTLSQDGGLQREVWKRLNRIPPQSMLGEGRVYGGGLHKLEPRELGNVPVRALAEWFPGAERQRLGRQGEMFGGRPR